MISKIEIIILIYRTVILYFNNIMIIKRITDSNRNN